MKKLVILLALVSLFCAPFVFADPPKFNPTKDTKYGAAGSPMWGQTEYIAAAGEFIPSSVGAVSIASTAYSSAPHLFKYGTIVMVTCDVDAIGFFVHDTGVTTATTGAVTDASSVGGRTTGANGFWIEAGLTRHVVVPYPTLSGNDVYSTENQVSLRSLSCMKTGSATSARALAGRPCDAVADCFHGTTNVTCSASNGSPKGSYLKVHPTAVAQCSFEIEQ